jgi:hypothetical protein
MMPTRSPIALLIGCALLAACGNKVDLRPIPGQTPAIAAGSTKPETSKKLTTPDAEAKPARSDELLKRSEERQTDDFDLPPPG